MEFAFDIVTVRHIIISLVIGFMLGLQRDISYYQHKRNGFAGARTFAMIALMGYLSAWLNQEIEFFVLVSFLIVGSFVLLSYIYKAFCKKLSGSTTEFTMIITYTLGLMVYYSKAQYAIMIAILLLIVLDIKGRLKHFRSFITPKDMQSTILFLAMTFIVLPLLPDRTIDPFGVFNPYETWIMVVLIAGISFMGYIAIKVLGTQRGIYLTGIFGGLVSSTAVSITLSKIYALKQDFLKNIAGAIAISFSIMYLRVLLEAFVINPALAHKLALSYLLASLFAFLFVIYLYRASSLMQHNETITINNNPLEISEALKLGLLFGVIFGSIAFFQSKMGDTGIYIVAFLSGLSDVDAITLSLSKLALEQISMEVAINGIIIATVTNSLVKLGIVWILGGKRLGGVIALYYLITLAPIIGAIFFLNRSTLMI
ncbi:MAG: hypothetical protein KU38_10345 [Sulfurovum sp. FS08-3]|nr:MAG: hypothetical protein KU38_10345 [Sulfurovum sp. FS08-3]